MDHNYVVEYRRLSGETGETVQSNTQQVVAETSQSSSGSLPPQRNVTPKRLVRVFPVVRKPNIAGGIQEELSTTRPLILTEHEEKKSDDTDSKTKVAVRKSC